MGMTPQVWHTFLLECLKLNQAGWGASVFSSLHRCSVLTLAQPLGLLFSCLGGMFWDIVLLEYEALPQPDPDPEHPST